MSLHSTSLLRPSPRGLEVPWDLQCEPKFAAIIPLPPLKKFRMEDELEVVSDRVCIPREKESRERMWHDPGIPGFAR